MRRGSDDHRADAIARMHAIARERGGKCRSKEYVRSSEHLTWECRHGHRWDATPSNVVQGKWCPHCAHVVPLTLDDMRRAARRKGGECLSEIYVNSVTPLLWRCREGHEWTAAPSGLLHRGRWCARCAGQATKTLDELRAFAAERKGELLSQRSVNAHAKLQWRCHLGHAFSMNENSVQQGRWCPMCLGRPRSDLARMQEVAQRHGGLCLSKRYSSDSKLRWRCRAGHTWTALASNIAAGQWCATCAYARRSGPFAPLTLSDVQETAAKRGGECISDEYINAVTKLRWRCASGHEWEQTAGAVRYGSWCPVCSKRYRGSIDGMNLLASDRGGRCLTEFYEGKRQLLRFVCARRHRFELSSVAAKSGAWCPACGA